MRHTIIANPELTPEALSADVQKVHAALSALQFGPATRYVMVKSPPIGLGGQITGRIVGLALGLSSGRKTIFPSLADPPYAQSYAPMSDLSVEDIPAIEPVSHTALQSDAPLVVYDPLALGVSHSELDELVLKEIIRKLNLRIDQKTLKGAIFRWLPLVQETQSFYAEKKLELGVGRETLGVHVRRGDKQVETAFVPVSAVNEAICRIYKTWKFRSIYLASDNEKVVGELAPPEGVSVIFDTTEQRYNNANHRMLIENPALARQETLSATKNIYLLASCGGVVGQDNAHFATVSAAALLADGIPPAHIELIDGRLVEKRSLMVRVAFAAKRQLREVAKMLLPGLRATARMERTRSGQ